MESAGTRGRYACLSHCWGANPIIKTEHSTLERYKQDIPLHDLPKTFQDAINFLRRMGVDYLWIDSLCIIQDSEDDWAEESAKMAEIYMNGFITIAATRGAVATTGLYSPMEDVNLSFPNGACFILRNRVVSHPGTLLNDNRVFGIPRVEENPFPLLGRGWVVQEMVLSQRVLHFCENELVFECDCGRACTCGFLQCEDNSLFNIADRTALKDIWPGGINGNHGLDSTFDLSRDQASSRWRNIVEYYGLCRLTFEKDKLPAISGIAWLLHKRYNIKYMAGLWLESIHTDLLWSTARAQHEDVWTISEQLANAGLNESTFVLPTWSWISATTRLTYMHAFFVEHEDGETIKYISVAKADCTPRSPLYPFGELKSAELVLNGWLLPIKVDLNYLKHGRIEFTDKEGCPFSGTLYLDKRTQISVERDSSGLFGVPIVKKYCHKDNIICMYFGLVVRKIEEGTGYERVGLWRLGIMDRDDELQKEAVIDTFFQTLVTELIVLV
jgi:hypothetical protein